MTYLRGPIMALLAFAIGVAISPPRFYVESSACGGVNGRGGDRFLASIFSSSYLHAIEFEKQHFHYYSER